MIIDSHTHIASPDTERYPVGPTGVGSAWWSTGLHGAEQLVAAMDGAGVDRAMVVQAVGAYGYDCAYAVDAVAAHPDRLALVGSVDMEDADPAQRLAELTAAAGEAGTTLRGVRLFGVTGTPPVWLTDGRAEQVWDVAAASGCTVVPTLFAGDLPGLRAPVEAHPDVVVILDHCGFPDLAGGPPYERASSLLDLVDLASLSLKISSHLLLDAAEASSGGDPADLVDHLAASFGADRLCWGSDYPQTQQLSYPDMVALGRRSARHLSVEDQDAFFAGTSARLWWDEPGSRPSDGGPTTARTEVDR